VTGVHDVVAMELAGLGVPRLYPQGWSGWIADEANPIALGPDDLGEVIDLDRAGEDLDA
jgi:thiosulfate/3-mercaptopyruvate sulfurtransferase